MISGSNKSLRKYAPLKEQAMYSRIKLTAWTMILFCSFLAIMTLSNDSEIRVPVQPTLEASFYDSTYKTYSTGVVQVSGNFVIKETHFLQRLLIPAQFLEFDILSCVLLIVLSAIILKLLPHVHSQVLFKTDISHWIGYIGWALMIFWLLDTARIFFYAIPEIKRLTNNQFVFRRTGYLMFPLQFWLGIGILWVSRLYKNAFRLKQEQELTI